MVKINVARRKTIRAIHTHLTVYTCSNRTKKTALICENVFALPKMLGEKLRSPAIANNTALAARIEISRLKTTTVYFHGIWCRIERTRNIVLNKSLSAVG